MTREQAFVEMFHRKCRVPIGLKPQLISEDEYQLRFDLIQEELDEYLDACVDQDLVKIADALGDLLYVVYGAAVVHGLDLEFIFEEIHKSNMTKEPQETHIPEIHKIKKGPNYVQPNLIPFVTEGVIEHHESM